MLKLQTPETLTDPADIGVDVHRDRLLKWLGELPMANPEVAGAQLLERINGINHSRLDPLERFSLLQILQPHAESLAESLRSRYLRTLLPLAPRYAVTHEQAIELSCALATGFKLVVRDIVEGHPNQEKLRTLLYTSIYMGVHHLSLVLLDIYIVYKPEPAHLWEEINHLYLLAEQEGTGDDPLMQPDKTAAPRTISLAYRRAVLMALANPYNLMQEEALTIFRLLYKLAAGCRLLHPDDDLPEAGFYVDLGADRGPQFARDTHSIRGIAPRIIAPTELLHAVQGRITALAGKEPKQDAIRKMSRLERRMQRDMLRRLERSWGRKSEREHERHAHLGHMDVVIGLSAAHHHVNGEQPFLPELDEVRIHTGYHPGSEPTGSGGLGLSLVPLDFEPWKAEEAESRIESGVTAPRVSSFDANGKTRDVWQKIYAHRGAIEAREAEASSFDTLYAISTWETKNASAQGMAMGCEHSRSLPVRVGEIVAYEPQGSERGKEHWSIGTIRWLRVLENDALEMGIMRLSEGARAVATRAVKGVGQGGEYFRSLVVPQDGLDAAHGHILTPAAIYDTDTVLALNLGDRIRYVRLDRLLEATRSFSQFEFTPVETPDSETANIKAMQAAIKAS